VVGDVGSMQEARSRSGSHRQRDQADEKIDTDRTVGVEGESTNEDRQPKLRPAKPNQTAEKGDGCTGTCRGDWSADRI